MEGGREREKNGRRMRGRELKTGPVPENPSLCPNVIANTSVTPLQIGREKEGTKRNEMGMRCMPNHFLTAMSGNENGGTIVKEKPSHGF